MTQDVHGKGSVCLKLFFFFLRCSNELFFLSYPFSLGQ